jgi:hypothetical protein
LSLVCFCLTLHNVCLFTEANKRECQIAINRGSCIFIIVSTFLSLFQLLFYVFCRICILTTFVSIWYCHSNFLSFLCFYLTLRNVCLFTEANKRECQIAINRGSCIFIIVSIVASLFHFLFFCRFDLYVGFCTSQI